MHYALLIYLDEPTSFARTDAEIKAGMAAHAPYIERLRQNGQYVSGDALGPSRAARTLRSEAGKVVAMEGPFAESREQLGGFYVVDAKNLDEAIALAADCPALRTVGVGIEIRPIPTPLVAAPSRAAGEPSAQGRFLLAMYRDESAPGLRLDDDDARRAEIARWSPYVAELRAAGRLADAEPLAPSSSATSLRLRSGKIELTDGPFQARREQLAAFCVASARDLDDAIDVARGWPGAPEHAIEVRPVRGAGG